MSKRNKANLHGWVNFNKPLNMTSTQAVGLIRRVFQVKKVGHGGTLDPLATGVLPIALGEATKTIPYIQDASKTYEFTVKWGEQRTTDDAEGDILHSSDQRPTMEDIEALLPEFVGDILQTPPQFSAIKIKGERAYDIARDGEHVDIQPRQVYIQNITIISHSEPESQRHNETSFHVVCGKGTYIRAIARDMGQKLGCFGYVSALKRTKVGALDVENAFSLDFFEKMRDNPNHYKDDALRALLPVHAVLDDILALNVTDDEAQRLKNGNKIVFVSRHDIDRLDQAQIDWQDKDQLHEVLLLHQEKPLAMAHIAGVSIQPVRVFNL